MAGTIQIDHTTHSINAVKNEFKAKGVYYTDSRLAELMKNELGEVSEVYDPTCGNGQLLAAFDDSVAKYGQEIDRSQLQVATERLANFTGYCGDTLKDPYFMDKKFQGIVANPPFSIKWEPANDVRFDDAPCLPPPSKADYAFLLHILYLLASDGKAVVLNFPGILYRGQREGKIRRWLVEQNVIDKVTHIEGGYFEDTKIATALVVLRKNRSEGYITFADHERQVEKQVPITEIAKNDYNLSVNIYLPIETEQEQIDPIECEKLARRGLLRKLRAELDMSKFVCEVEHLPFTPFLDEIVALVNTYRDNQ